MNLQSCLEMNNSSTEKCRFCMGTGNVTVELGGDENEVSRCINCDGAGTLTCTTCQGSGIQPRYLDRRYLLCFFYLVVLSLKLGTGPKAIERPLWKLTECLHFPLNREFKDDD